MARFVAADDAGAASASRAATRLLPLPMPPNRPMTGFFTARSSWGPRRNAPGLLHALNSLNDPGAFCGRATTSSTSSQFGPVATSTFKGTSSFSLASSGVVISSRTRLTTSSTSPGGTSKTSSS